MSADVLDITFGDGKYRIVQEPGNNPKAYRHGEFWPAMTRDLVGNNCVLSLAWEFHQLKQSILKEIVQLEQDALNPDDLEHLRSCRDKREVLLKILKGEAK